MAMVRLIHHGSELAHWAAEKLEYSDQYYVAGCWYVATNIQPVPRQGGHGAVRYDVRVVPSPQPQRTGRRLRIG
jgi:hypothetical protein